MITIDLMRTPNQSLTFTHEGVLWKLVIKVGNTTMVADISRNEEPLIRGTRIVADAPIMPYRYLSTDGNFAIATVDGEIPWWEKFGSDHTLVYLSPEEVGL